MGGKPRFDSAPQDYEAQSKKFDELASNSKTTSNMVQSVFIHVTHGRYTPEDVRVQQAPESTGIKLAKLFCKTKISVFL